MGGIVSVQTSTECLVLLSSVAFKCIELTRNVGNRKAASITIVRHRQLVNFLMSRRAKTVLAQPVSMETRQAVVNDVALNTVDMLNVWVVYPLSQNILARLPLRLMNLTAPVMLVGFAVLYYQVRSGRIKIASSLTL